MMVVSRGATDRRPELQAWDTLPQRLGLLLWCLFPKGQKTVLALGAQEG